MNTIPTSHHGFTSLLGGVMAINWRVWHRKAHRVGAAVVAGPFLIVVVTGLLLQVKKEWAWVQPPTQRGVGKVPTLRLEEILLAVRSHPEARVAGWEDIDRIDVQPRRGVAKVQTVDRWEFQVDCATGEVLQVAYRRSDVIEAIHDGSWFHDWAKLGVFLPSGVIVLGLLLTGMYLYVLPYRVRARQRRERARLQ